MFKFWKVFDDLEKTLKMRFPIHIQTSSFERYDHRGNSRGNAEPGRRPSGKGRDRVSWGWRVGGGYEPFTQHPWRRTAIVVSLVIFWVTVSLARVDWDSAKSLKSTRGCRSIAGVEDKWGNGQLAESFPPFTRGAPRFASITKCSRWSLWSLFPAIINYLWLAGVTAPEVAARHALPLRRGGG